MTTRFRGDLAFHCSDTNVAKRLVSWAHSREHGNPRCEEDLGEIEFVDLLRDIAEEKHLDLCVDVAFAGTEEAAEEADASDAIDAVVAEEDRGDDSDAIRETDAEAELLDAMPLLGMPKTERERRKTPQRLAQVHACAYAKSSRGAARLH